MGRSMHIGVLVDASEVRDDDPNFESVPEIPITEYHVIRALRNLGHTVLAIGISDIETVIKTLTTQQFDVIFNLTESFNGDRAMDKNIVGLLEMLGLPFTGTGAMGLILSRDKGLCKQLLSLHKIRVPAFHSLPVGRKIRIPKSIHYPLVVKPALEDSSEGISNASLVGNDNELTERVRFIHERWNQPVIAEEYIEGREFYVGVMGNKKLTVLPIREFFFNSDGGEGPQLATYRVKWDAEYREKWNIRFDFAELDGKIIENIGHVCKKVYRILNIRDYGRIDLRLTADNKIVILEANPNPDLAYGEEIAEAAEKAGMPYDKFIGRILYLAQRRYD